MRSLQSEKERKNRGITLIALVVTIAVLIILATVSINAIFSDNGIIKQARKSKDIAANQVKYDEEDIKRLEEKYANEMAGGFDTEENKKLVTGITLSQTTVTIKVGESITLTATVSPENASNKNVKWSSSNEGVATVVNGTVTAKTVGTVTITVEAQDGSGVKATCSVTVKTPSVGDETTKPPTWTSDKVKPIEDGSGNAIPLPDGFYYVGGDRETGLVISDNSSDENRGTSYETASTLQGNQFVWIPVDSESDLERTNFASNGQPTTTGLRSDYTEPYANGYSDGNGTQEIAEFNTMKSQVLKYGGFYIGRYEAGDWTNGTTLRTTYTTAHTVVCKKGVAPYNYVPWGKSLSDPGELDGKSGAVYLSKNMYTGKVQEESVVSTLCYGSQWDAMCRYIGDSQRTTPTKSAPELTGSVSTDVSKNIYDLAGNCIEWTMEAYSTYNRVYRGGNCLNANPVSSRNSYGPTNAGKSHSFRFGLYVKD